MRLLCSWCNWQARRHYTTDHGEVCLHGHPIERVGRDRWGRCRECRRVRARAAYDADPERDNERCRRYHAEHREAVVARKRARRSGRAVIGERPGHRGAEGAPPPPDHPWRK